MEELRLSEISPEIIERLEKGVFLTAKHGGKTNTMTIGWVTLGRVWNREVCTVMVRYSRYTHELIRKAGYYTVSIPEKGKLEKELDLLGKKSGKDMDKYSASGLKLACIEGVETPIIEAKGIHLACKILYRQSMAPESLDESIDDEWYADRDYHVIYYGEVLKAYRR